MMRLVETFLMLPVGLCLEPFSFCSQYAPASKQGPHSSTAIAVETIGSAFEFRIKLSAADASVQHWITQTEP